MKQLLAKLALVASTLALGPTGASAEVMVKIQNVGFGSGPIRVISENGTSWTKILESDLTLPVQINLGISSGTPKKWTIKQLGTTIAESAHYLNPPLHIEETHTVTGSTKNFNFETQSIIGACNNFLNSGGGLQQKHTVYHGVQLELIGDFLMTNNEPYPPYSGYGTVPVMVECMPYLPPAGVGVSVDAGDAPTQTPVLIKEAKLFLTTYTNGQNAGITLGACPMLRTSVRFETNKQGRVTFDLHRYPGGGTSHTVNAEAESGKFFAHYEKNESFSSTTSVQYKAQSTTPTGGNTGWKHITVHCGGGLAPNPSSTSNPDAGNPSKPLHIIGKEATVTPEPTRMSTPERVISTKPKIKETGDRVVTKKVTLDKIKPQPNRKSTADAMQEKKLTKKLLKVKKRGKNGSKQKSADGKGATVRFR